MGIIRWAAVTVALPGCLAGCSQPETSRSSAPSATLTPLAAMLPNGIYVDAVLAPVCTSTPAPPQCPDYSGPHYFVDLTVTGPDSLHGFVAASAQDGSTTILFIFTGSAQSGTASLTVTGIGPPDPHNPWIQSGSLSTGEVLTASYPRASVQTNWPSGLDGSRVLTLDGCGAYLTLAPTRPDCDFALQSR